MGNQDHVTLELQALLDKQPLIETKSCSIYKVPDEIRQSNVEAYIPMVVSIGPLHHGDSRLQKMEDHKLLYYKHFIQSSNASLSELVSCVRELEPQIRACYSEKIDLTADEFVRVILVDSAFIIELLLTDEWAKDDVIFLQPWLLSRVASDLILLENQLPFFVFQKLHNLAFSSFLLNNGHHEFPSFMKLAFRFFSFTLNFNKPPEPPHDSSILNFTDLIRYLYLMKQRPSKREHKPLVLGYTAYELVEAGVKFVVNESSSSHGCMLDLEFEHGTLKIPHIGVDDGTEILLRNIVALEQCHYPQEHYIIDYVRFFGQLINTNKDAGVLIKAGIIDDMVGGNYESSVAKLFSDVRKNITVTTANVDYLKLCHDLNAYYNHPWHSKMATLRRDYFTTPWKTAASIAGIFLLILTVIQTVCSILQVLLS
ncbi:UPF0481 protein At3g47200-like [Arachis duranensis]|uniref:UPF0481 protein At3g47200-like n=1 Tax=Arachis duranensis TaxID=130453 RepID=A0A6P5MDA4_ARADU|nr:UPF0481 protein At3g47200-like [Arachis duranensis]